MSLRLYMDHNIHAAITRAVRAAGVDVLTAHEDNAAHLPDPLLLERAIELQRVLVSQDDDLLVLGSHHIRNAIPFPGLIYSHPLAITLGQAIADITLIAQILPPEEIQNQIIWLPL